MSAVLALIISVLSTLGITYDEYEPTKTPCEGSVITVDRDEETPCDVLPGQRLDVTNVTIAECVDMGGEPIRVFIAVPTTCSDVDF